MKRTILLASVLLLILLLPVTVTAVGNISVSSSPSGATIYLDGLSRQTTTPAIIEDVTSGSHTILLMLTGYQDNSQTVAVADNQTSTVSATLTASIAAPTITSITPAYGYNSGIVSITGLTGTGFVSGATVVLAKSGETNISAASVSVTSTQITCTFDLTSKTAGTWNVIVTNPDGQSATKSSAFEIRTPTTAVTLSSISPSSALTNTTVSITDLAGTNFAGTPTIYLMKSGYNNVPGVVSTITATKIVGSFDLSQRTPGTYQVCVVNSGMDAVCGLTFTITSSDTVSGTISFGSSPSGSSVYLNASKIGTTPFSLYDQVPGSYFIRMQRADYSDYTTQVLVTPGNTTQVYAYLTPATTYTNTPASTPIPTFTTVQTTKKSTIKVPTPWPSATTAPASPVGPLVILGAIGLGFVILKKD